MRWLALIAVALAAMYVWWPRPPAPVPASLPASAPATPQVAIVPFEPPVAAAPARPYGFCPEPNETLPAIQKIPRDAYGDLQSGIKLADTLDISKAREHLAAYLKQVPDDVRVQRLQARLEIQEDLMRDHLRIEERGLSISYPREFRARDTLRTVGDALDEAARLTGTARRGPLAIVVYNDRSELLAATCTPTWVGGVFDGTLRLLSDADEEVIRHESLHAQLSPHMQPEPKWFHEGLAQYFADRGQFQWNRAYALMAKNKTYIPFSSLNGSFFVFTGNQDAQLAYAQSLAMIHWLVEKKGEHAIAEAVKAKGELGLDERTFLEFLKDRAP